MEAMAVLVPEQVFRDNSVLKLRRQRPLARHHVVARQVPPEVVVQVLRSAIDLPAPKNIKGLAIAWLLSVLAFVGLGSYILDRTQHITWLQQQELLRADDQI